MATQHKRLIEKKNNNNNNKSNESTKSHSNSVFRFCSPSYLCDLVPVCANVNSVSVYRLRRNNRKKQNVTKTQRNYTAHSPRIVCLSTYETNSVKIYFNSYMEQIHK